MIHCFSMLRFSEKNTYFYIGPDYMRRINQGLFSSNIVQNENVAMGSKQKRCQTKLTYP